MKENTINVDRLYTEHFEHLKTVYERALTNHQFSSLIVFSGTIKKQIFDDMVYPFYVNLQFKALVPLTQMPESWIIWRPSQKPMLLLYQPDDYWHGTQPLPTETWAQHFDIIPISKTEQAQAYFGDTSGSAFLGETNDLIGQWDLGEHNPKALIAELNWYRSYKTLYEQSCIREANRITVNGHLAAKEAFFSGASELEISLAFQSGCQQPEEALSFPSIVGINEHAAILHYTHRDLRRIPANKRHSLLIDAGAIYRGYAADTCRTYAYPEGLFADMVEALDELQQNIVSETKVGSRYFDVSIRAMRGLASLLNTFGVLKIDPDSAVKLDLVRYFMPHRLGHFLGLQVHDVGDNQADVSGAELDIDSKFPKVNMMRAIEVDQVVTVEPGVYFIETLLKQLSQSEHSNKFNWDRIEVLKPYGGIRIEDNVLVTPDGPVNITREAFDEIG